MNDILVPLAPADLIDRLAVMKLAVETTVDPALEQRRNLLQRTADRLLPANDALCALRIALYNVYADLQLLEADMRASEARSDFGPGFIALTRSYLATIDQRDQIKSDIVQLVRKI